MCEQCMPTALEAYEHWRRTYKALSPEAEHLAGQLHQSLQTHAGKAVLKEMHRRTFPPAPPPERITDLWPARIVAVHQSGAKAEAVVTINMDTGRVHARWTPYHTGEWWIEVADR